MPVHQVGSLDSWLESPYASCAIGSSIVPLCQSRPRSILGGPPSRSAPVADCIVAENASSLGAFVLGNTGESIVDEAATTVAGCGWANNPSRVPLAPSDKYTSASATYIVVSRDSASLKRKSLLSEQLRSATSLPLLGCAAPPLPVEADDVAHATRTLGAINTSPSAHSKQQSTVATKQQPNADSLPTMSTLTPAAPAGISITTTSYETCRSTSLPSPVRNQGIIVTTTNTTNTNTTTNTDSNSILMDVPLSVRIDAAVPKPLACPHPDTYVSTSGGSGADDVPLYGGAVAAATRGTGSSSSCSPSRQPLVLITTGSMDADVSSTCCGGSLACSTSTGFFSSGSNVLHYCRGDREDGSNEPLFVHIPGSALTASHHHWTGQGAGGFAVEVQSFAGPATSTAAGASGPGTILRALSAAQQQCCHSDAMSQITPYAAADPEKCAVSTGTQGSPSLDTSAPATSKPVISAAESGSIGSLVVCSATDLVSGSPSYSDREHRSRTSAIQLAAAAHLATACAAGEGNVDADDAASSHGAADTDEVTAAVAAAASLNAVAGGDEAAAGASFLLMPQVASESSRSKAGSDPPDLRVISQTASRPASAEARAVAAVAAQRLEATGGDMGAHGKAGLSSLITATATTDPHADADITAATPSAGSSDELPVRAPQVELATAETRDPLSLPSSTAAPPPLSSSSSSSSSSPSSMSPFLNFPTQLPHLEKQQEQAKGTSIGDGEEQPKSPFLTLSRVPEEEGSLHQSFEQSSSLRGRSKRVPFSSLFSTVLLVPKIVGNNNASALLGNEYAVQQYGASRGMLQHSMSLGSARLDCRGQFWGQGGEEAIEAAGEPATATIDRRLRDAVEARRSFDVSKALSRTRVSSGARGFRDSISGLLEAEMDPAMYEGTVRRGLPRRAAALALARTMSQPVTQEVDMLPPSEM